MNRHAIASGVFDLKHRSIDQALAAKVLNLDHHSSEQVPAPKVVHLNRNNPAPRIFHLNHHTIRQALAPDSFVSGLKSGWRVLEDADFPALADQVVLLRWKQ